MSEITDIHEPFMRYLREQGIEFIRARSDKASTIEASWPDFSLLHPAYPAIFLEMKMDKAPLTAGQKKLHARLMGRGHLVWVCRSVKEAVEITEAWIAGQTFRRPATANVASARADLRIHAGWVWTPVEGRYCQMRRATAEDIHLPKLLP